jgi:hypothetical protein
MASYLEHSARYSSWSRAESVDAAVIELDRPRSLAPDYRRSTVGAHR